MRYAAGYGLAGKSKLSHMGVDYNYTITDSAIVIIDEDRGGTSVTNGIKDVLTDIARKEHLIGSNL